MSVRRLRIVVAVVALGFVLALALGSAGLLGGGKALGSSTTITVIGGDVSVRHGANASYVAAVDGEVLAAGDGVRTGAEGRAVLTYFEGSTVTIEPSTDLVIDAAETQGSNTIVEMTQNAGRTWHVVTKLVTGDSKYEVRTPASTASVRGTAFTVDTDGTTTTITTTEGTVLDQVPDPQNPGQTISVPVRAGQQHEQQRGQGAGPTQNAPDPERKVTVTLSDENTVVIDTLGRANGIDKNGRTLLQTPGATLTKVDGHLVITLPNLPDGLLRALTRKAGGDVDMQTVVEEKGKGADTSSTHISSDAATGQGHADVAIGKKTNADASPTPAPTESATPKPTEASGSNGAGTSTDASNTSNTSNGGGQSGNGNDNSGNGNSGNATGQGNGNSGQGQGKGGFVPPPVNLTQPSFGPSPSPTSAPTQHGNSGGPQGGGGSGGGTNPGSGGGTNPGSGGGTNPGSGGGTNPGSGKSGNGRPP